VRPGYDGDNGTTTERPLTTKGTKVTKGTDKTATYLVLPLLSVSLLLFLVNLVPLVVK
jgi:hypothetical protein